MNALQAVADTVIDQPGEAMPETMDTAEHLSMLIRYFEEAESSTQDARRWAERDRDYYDNDQWTAEERSILAKRKQPVLTINYIKTKVEIQRGIERRQRSDPKAFPRNPQDEQTANVATDALRFVADQNNFHETRSSVYENMIIEGFGGCDVYIEDQPDGARKVCVKRVPWDRLFYDPHSSDHDFGDCLYKGIVIWQDAEGEDDPAVGETLRLSSSETYDDRPTTAWVDSRRKRVRKVQMHYKHDGEWMVATFTRGGFFKGGEPVVSPYKDSHGNSASSLIMRSAFVDRQNRRYGDVRAYISIQDEINKRRSKALHLTNTRQTFGNKTALQDAAKAKLELAKPDGHVELTGGAVFGQDFGTLPTGDMASGQMDLMQMAISEMNRSGPNAAMAGKAPGQQSGRALEAQMQGGSVEIEPLLDGLRQFSRDVYEAMWMRIRQFWTDEVWVRVTDDERNVKFVGVNKKTTLGERVAQMQPEMQAAWMQQNQIVPGDPRLQEVIGVENDVSGLDVDIVLEEGPDLSMLQSEQFETLADLAGKGLPIPAKAIVQASSIRNKESILKEMEQGGQMSPEAQKAIGEKDAQIAEMQKALEQAAAEHQKAMEQMQQLKMDQSSIVQKAQIEGEARMQTAMMEAEVGAQVKVQVAEINARADQEIKAMLAARQVAQIPVIDAKEPAETTEVPMVAQTMMMLAQVLEGMNQPKPPMQIVHQRDENGLIVASTEVQA